MNENNENATGWSRSKWKVRRTLERNRTLLRSLREHASVAEEDANAWLVRRGFDFEYHTHVLTTLEEKWWSCVTTRDTPWTVAAFNLGRIRETQRFLRRLPPEPDFDEDFRFFSWNAPL